METLVRAVGVLSLMTVVFLSVMIGFGQEHFPWRLAPTDESAETCGGGDLNPVLTIEFKKTEDVGDFLGKAKDGGKSAACWKIRRGLAWDNVFIAAYWLLFVGLSLLLAQRRRPGGAPLWLAVFAALCGTGAAISDTVENARALVLLDAEKATRPLHLTLAAASDEKWLLIGLATLALSFIFVWKGDTKSRLGGGALFLLYLAVGVLLIAGVFAGVQDLIGLAVILFGVGLIAVAALFTFGSPWVARRLRGADGGEKVL